MRLRFADFELDSEALELRRAGEPVEIGSQALDLLLWLLRHRDRVVSREELHEVLWPGRAIGETSLGQTVRQARNALADDGTVQRWIRNVRGRGYRFIGDVDVLRTEGASPTIDTPAPIVSPARSHTGLVGRERELAALDSALDSVRSGKGGVVWLAGEAGIGKSRLIEELVDRAGQAGMRVLRGECVDGDWALPYGPFAEAIATGLRALSPDALLGPAGDAVRRLAGVSPAGPRAPGAATAASREEERRQLFDAFAASLDALSARRPLVLIIDDLQWADASTLTLAHYAARRATHGRWLLVGAYRDDEAEGDVPLAQALPGLLGLGERRAPLRLGGLEPQETRLLLQRLADRTLPETLVRGIHDRTGGNPFFAREILRHLLEQGVLVSEQGQWRKDLALEDLSLPEGVRQVLSERLQRLAPHTRDLLAVASVVGEHFSFSVTERASGLSESESLDALEEALDARVLEDAEPAGHYRFVNALIRHTLYGDQSAVRRLRRHRRVAEVLVELQQEGNATPAGPIAHQYHASAALPGAVAGIPYCISAADLAERVAAYDEEASYVRLALDLMPGGDERRAVLAARHGLALAFSGDASRAAPAATEAAHLLAAQRGEDAAARYLADVVEASSWAASQLAWELAGQGLEFTGDVHDVTWARLQFIDLWRRESEDGGPRDSPERRATTLEMLDRWVEIEPARKGGLALVGLAFASRTEVLERAGDTAVFVGLWGGDYEKALALAREEERLARGSLEPGTGYLRLTLISRLEAALGRIALAEEAFEASEVLYRQLPAGPHFDIVRASTRNEIAQVTGEGFEALAPVFADLSRSADSGSQWAMAAVMCVSAEIHARTDREADACRFLEAGLPGLVRSPGWLTAYPLMAHAAAAAAWVMGRGEWAALIEEQIQQKTLRPDFRFPSTDARLSLARLCALGGRREEARSWFEQARRVLDDQGARPLRALVDLDEARMHRECEPRRAAEQLDAALEQFERVGMPGWSRCAAALQRELET